MQFTYFMSCLRKKGTRKNAYLKNLKKTITSKWSFFSTSVDFRLYNKIFISFLHHLQTIHYKKQNKKQNKKQKKKKTDTSIYS